MILNPGPYDSGQIFVDCRFDGITRSCHLDTGATSTFLQDDEDSRDFEKVGTKKFKTAASSELTCDEIRLSKVESLGVVLRDHIVVRCPPSMKNTVGVDFFKGGNAFIFDFKKSRIELIQPLDLKLEGHDFSVLEKGLWTVPAMLNDAELDAVWDTGAGLTSVSRDFVTANPDGFKFVQALGDSGDTSGNLIQMDLYVASQARIGRADLKNISVLVFDFTPIKQKMGLDVDLILGYNIITARNWYFDFASKIFSVE